MIDREHTLVKLNSTQSEDLSPIEETPLDDGDQSNGVTSTTCLPIRVSSTMSDKIWSVEQDIRNLRLEAMQKEAVEKSLKEDIEQLRDELDRTVREKWNAEKELRIKQRKVAELTSAMKRERRKVEDKADEVDGLKIQLADGEVSREKLAKRVGDLKRQLLKQEATIKEKERIICELRSKMLGLERTNALLQRSNSYDPGGECKGEEWEDVDMVVMQRSNSSHLREEIQQKDTKLQETKEELLWCKNQLSKGHNRQRMYMVVIGLLVVVMAIVAYMYIYHRENVQCIVRSLPM